MPLLAVETGDSYQKVVEEKGVPTSKIEAGDTLILNYPESIIKLRDGKVIGIKSRDGGDPVLVNGVPPPKPTVAAGQWTTDYAAALKQAKAEKKKVFLFFTGSDWCGWCKRLDGEVLSKADFKNYAQTNLVLVKLDFPRGIPQSAQLKANNQKLSEQYQIEGYPTIVVLDSSGKAVGRLGYMPGGPGPFIKELKKF